MEHFSSNNYFRNKYKTNSLRLRGWNYANSAYYFVTLCTKWRIHHFGEIRDAKMTLSKIGQMADKCWQGIPEHYPNVVLDEYIIMPDHIQGILFIKNPAKKAHNYVPEPKEKCFDIKLDLAYKNIFGPQSRNLSAIIRGYKIGFTKLSKYCDSNFEWLPLFYESIIRNPKHLDNVRNYIKRNPLMWEIEKNKNEKFRKFL